MKQKKSADKTLEIMEVILDYNKNAQIIFPLASEVENQNQHLKKALQKEQN